MANLTIFLPVTSKLPTGQSRGLPYAQILTNLLRRFPSVVSTHAQHSYLNRDGDLIVETGYLFSIQPTSSYIADHLFVANYVDDLARSHNHRRIYWSNSEGRVITGPNGFYQPPTKATPNALNP